MGLKINQEGIFIFCPTLILFEFFMLGFKDIMFLTVVLCFNAIRPNMSFGLTIYIICFGSSIDEDGRVGVFVDAVGKAFVKTFMGLTLLVIP